MSDINTEEDLAPARFTAVASAQYEKLVQEDWAALKPKLLKACLDAASKGDFEATIETPPRTISWIMKRLNHMGYSTCEYGSGKLKVFFGAE